MVLSLELGSQSMLPLGKAGLSTLSGGARAWFGYLIPLMQILQLVSLERKNSLAVQRKYSLGGAMAACFGLGSSSQFCLTPSERQGFASDSMTKMNGVHLILGLLILTLGS